MRMEGGPYFAHCSTGAKATYREAGGGQLLEGQGETEAQGDPPHGRLIGRPPGPRLAAIAFRRSRTLKDLPTITDLIPA